MAKAIKWRITIAYLSMHPTNKTACVRNAALVVEAETEKDAKTKGLELAKQMYGDDARVSSVKAW